MDYPKRLQGTDGIRREVDLLSDADPITAIIVDNVISPKFIESYSYTVAKWVEKNKGTKNTLNIGIGYDPRDKEKTLIDSAVIGIRKAGANAYDLGIIPTPVVPLYLINKGLDAALMITASHNPEDQNGVKIFLEYGLKTFPEDDEEITKLFYDFFRDNRLNMELMKLKGSVFESKLEAQKLFKKFMLDSKNNWLTKEVNLEKIILILDCANGSYSQVALSILEEMGFTNIIETASNINGKVNENSGVVDLEGEEFITGEQINKNFKNNLTITNLYNTGKKYHDDIINGNKKVIAFIFDADGDRFYRAEYDPYNDGIVILSGDENAILQARYLTSLFSEKLNNAKFVSTIESDYNVYLFAREIGLNSILTGVGDKWILKESIYSYMDMFTEKPDDLDRVEKIKNRSNISAFEIIKAIKNLPTANISKHKDYIKKIKFAIGSEESGHNISNAYTKDFNNKLVPIFVGNGLKSAINSVVSTERLSKNNSPEDYYNLLKTPFKKGFKQTFYVYYTDKSKLLNLNFRKEVKSFIENNIPENFTGIDYPIKEEKDAIFYKVLTNNNEVGSVFLRNSGTEEKTGIYLRCKVDYKNEIIGLCESIKDFIFNNMKDKKNKYAIAEQKLLNYIVDNEKIHKDKVEEITKEYDINSNRLITEMEKKEKLIYLNGGQYFLIKK